MCVYILRHGLPYCHSLQTFAGEGPQKVGNSHSRSHSAVPGTTSHQALLWPWPSKLSWDAQQKLSRIHGRVIKEFPLEWWFQSTLVGVPNSFSWPCIFCANNYPADPQRSCHQGKIAKRNPRGRGSFFLVLAHLAMAHQPENYNVVISIYLFSYLSTYLSIHLFLSLSLSLSISCYLCQSMSISVYLLLSVSISVYLSLSISVYLYLSIYPSIVLFIYLSFCLSVYLYKYIICYILIYIYVFLYLYTYFCF